MYFYKAMLLTLISNTLCLTLVYLIFNNCFFLIIRNQRLNFFIYKVIIQCRIPEDDLALFVINENRRSVE